MVQNIFERLQCELEAKLLSNQPETSEHVLRRLRICKVAKLQNPSKSCKIHPRAAKSILWSTRANVKTFLRLPEPSNHRFPIELSPPTSCINLDPPVHSHAHLFNCRKIFTNPELHTHDPNAKFLQPPGHISQHRASKSATAQSPETNAAILLAQAVRPSVRCRVSSPHSF